MTISATQVRKTFTGDGSTTAFTYNYRFLANADLKVYQEGTLKTITTHYTVTGAGNAGGGTVTFLTAPALNDEIVILNDPSNTQSLDLVDNDIFPAESMEQVLDRLTLQIQRCRDLLSRTVTLSDTDLSAGTWTLPSPVASYYLRWNSGGTQLESVAALASTVAVSPFTETLLDETSASAWRTGLGLGTLAIQNAANVSISGGTISGGTVTSGVTLPAATESYAGALEIATDAEARAFTANKAIDGAKLATAFTGGNQDVTGGDGYQKLPGGLILQWGRAVSPGSSGTLSFPVAFPTGCLFVATPTESTTSYLTNATSLTASGFDFNSRDPSTSGLSNQTFRWFAIGY